jgi:hypothetical protein
MTPTASRTLEFLSHNPNGSVVCNRNDAQSLLIHTNGKILVKGGVGKIEARALPAGVFEITLVAVPSKPAVCCSSKLGHERLGVAILDALALAFEIGADKVYAGNFIFDDNNEFTFKQAVLKWAATKEKS